jgi:enterochelin esterase-like enzyme/outer membrane protein assembly factor BamB
MNDYTIFGHVKRLDFTVILLLSFCFVDSGISQNMGNNSSSDWPNWLGVSFNGKSSASNVFKFDQGYGLKVAWKKELGPGYSGISVANGLAITMFSDSTFDHMIAFDAEKGEELWRYKLDSTQIGRGGAQNGPLSFPAIDGDVVYGLGPKGQLFALELQSGKQLWLKNIKTEHQAIQPFHGFTTSPLIHNDVLVVATGSAKNAFSGFNKNTGELIWSSGNDTINYQSPVMMSIAGENQLICSGGNSIHGLDYRTGEILWKFDHNGRNESLNPVLTDNNGLMFNHDFRGAMLIEVKKTNEKYNVSEKWKSRDIKFTYNVPIYHQGHLYGYSRNFLTCVNAETGKKVWRSRPPGNGFFIFVDGHLVIMTTTGSLHIVEATSEAYREKANIKIFDTHTWTPPAFADGKIYVRNVEGIACIELTPVSDLVEIKPAKPQIIVAQSEFATFIKKVESSSEKKQLIDDYLTSQKRFPIIEKDSLVHFVYRGEAEEIALLGDMFNFSEQVVMNKTAGADFYYHTVALEPDARISYLFLKDFEEQITDPLNSAKAPSLIYQEVSELTMPLFVDPAHLKEPTGDRGKLDSIKFSSAILGNTRDVHVYLPNGYEQNDQRYPVIFVNYGTSAIEMGKMPNTLDNLIGKRIKPVIAVFVDSPNSFQEYARERRAEYANMIAKELAPYIDKNYRTKATPEARAFIGGDEGGYSAFYTAFKYPDTFSMLAAQSAHLFPPEGDELRDLVRNSEKQPFTIYLDWGRYDHRNTAQGFSWVTLNQNFAKILKDKGYKISGGQVNDGFEWPSWRTRTDKILETFFGLSM